MEAVTRVSRTIADLTGPSCCKAYVRSSLETAVDYLRESLAIDLSMPSKAIECNHSLKHPHGCRETKCPYFKSSADTKEVTDNLKTERSINLEEGKTREDSMEYLTKKSLELGAERAKLIDTDSIVVEEWVRWKCQVVEEWVRWKCQYGCPLYDKDGFHPPCAPDAVSTKKVVKEYTKAILMNGPKGKLLTEAAVKLEGEAYHMGYYKAFALTALSSGPPGAT
jgi:hypothetical protein